MELFKTTCFRSFQLELRTNMANSNLITDNLLKKELYFECLGHLMGLKFKPKSSLQLVNGEQIDENTEARDKDDRVDCLGSQSPILLPLSQRRNKDRVSETNGDQHILKVNDLSLEKAKTWKSGAVTQALSKFGMRMQSHCNTQGQSVKWESFVLKHQIEDLEGNIPKASSRQSRPQMKDVGVGTDFTDTSLFITPRTVGLSKTNKTFKVPMKRPNTFSHEDEGEVQSNNPAFSNTKRPKFQIEDSNHRNSTIETNNARNGLFSSSRKDKSTLESEAEHEGSETEIPLPTKLPSFKSALSALIENDKKKGIKRNLEPPPSTTLPITQDKNKSDASGESNTVSNNPELEELLAHEKMKVFEPKIVEAVLSEVMEEQLHTEWNDIAGLVGPKAIIREIIIWPMLRPDIFTGLRSSPKGILLFGPPGTGKTMIGRLIATQCKSTFFNISASSLTSKWIGDGEKMVRCLFEVARIKQPSVIFIDEIDSILTQRSDTEHESSRRLKTEFLIQFDGCGTKQDDRVLVIGVTNRPQELDEAARRRLVKRIYIPLPDFQGRKQIVQNLMHDQNCKLGEDDIDKIADLTEGYSGADMRSLCQEASYGPIRDIGNMGETLENISAENVRSIELKDFCFAVKRVKSSVALKDLNLYEEWDDSFGCHIGQ